MDPTFDEVLLKDEKIVWKGQPELSKNFTRADFFLVPFSIIWGGMAIFWEASALGVTSFSETSKAGAPIAFPIFGIPFVVIGLYFIFGRFILKRVKKSKTWYLVTNQRVVVVSNFLGNSVNSSRIDLIPNHSKYIDSKGIGTLVFGSSNFMMSMYSNTGLDFFGSFYGQEPPTFHDIRDAEVVYKLIMEKK